MRLYNVAFYSILFFLAGIFLTALALNILVVIFIVALIIALFLFVYYLSPEKYGRKFFWFSFLLLFIIIGAFYYSWYENYQKQNTNIVFGRKINFQGLVVDKPERGNQQKLAVELKPPYAGKILAKLQTYPNFDYGDLINFEGIIKQPESRNYANYLLKDGISGIISFPKNELIAKNRGSSIKSNLFKLKEKLVTNLQEVLPSEKAAFLAGITLGEREEFSDEFKEAMKNSGTTHLVALSGYNISILAIVITSSLGYFVSRRLNFWLTLSIILGFVLMTGAETSVVRAAIMGGILLLAKQVGRLYSFRNSIVIAAFLMVLGNPKILIFDIGFQLSFAALLGIVYLEPAIKKFLKVSETDDCRGFLSWKENLLTTLSAQLAVLPLLVLHFGNFSPISLLPNLLILSVIPLTMSLGFILGFLGFISYHLSLIFGWFVNIFLFYETFLIKFFGSLDILRITSLSIPLAIVYYIILIAFLLYVRRLRFNPSQVKSERSI